MTNEEETLTVSSNFADPKPTSKRRELVDIWVDEVAEKAKTTPGALFLHLEISNAIGIPYVSNGRTNPNYQAWVQYAKNRLIKKHSLFLDSVTRVGYVLTPPGDEIEVCNKGIKKGVNKIVKELEKIQRINLSKIDNEDKRNKTIEGANKASNTYALLRQSQIAA